MNAEPTVFIVDDDQAVRDSLALLVRAAGLQARCYGTAQEFLDEYRPDQAGCVVADIRMPGLSGLELQDRLIGDGADIPVIILTGHGNVPAAVRALKHGALDFVQKPFDPHQLVDQIKRAIDMDLETRRTAAREADVAARVASLTPREREIMDLVIGGHANKVIAIDLGISERTVELHRSRVMKKMGARSLAHLLRLGGKPS